MRSWKRFVPGGIALVFGVAAAAYPFFERVHNWTQSPLLLAEQKLFDYKLLLRGRIHVEPKVVIAAGDEKTITAWGRFGTWDRQRFRKVLDNLLAAGAEVVAIDMLFADPVGIDHESTARLRALLEEARLSDAAGALALRVVEQGGAATPAELTGLAIAAKALEDRFAQSIAGDAALREGFDEHTSSVVQGFILNPSPEEGATEVRDPEVLARLDAFALLDYGFAWRTTDLDAEGAAAGAEQRMVTLVKHPGGRPADLVRVRDARGLMLLPDRRFLEVASNLGFFSAEPDSDGVMRKLPLVYRVGDRFLPSLALSAAALAFGSTPLLLADADLREGLAEIGFAREGGGLTRVPVDPDGALRINYYGPGGPPSAHVPEDERGTFPRLSLADIHDGSFDRELVRGKIVLVAVTAIATFDQRVTPFSPILPGVEIHAAAVQNMISGQAFRRPGLHVQAEMAVALLVALLLGLVLPSVSVTASLAFALLLTAGWLATDFFVLFRENLWLYDFPIVLQIAFTWAGITVWGYVTQGREKAKLKKEFSTVLAPTVVERLLEDPELAGLGGMEREMTVMFSDIRGFTTMSEGLTPEGLTRFLNEYLTPMTDILIRREGTLDKYMGDAIMAFWGAPIEQKDHAARAALAALDMLEKLEEMQQRWRAEGKPEIDVGIGLSSGLMRVGFMGSERMRSYTILGDNVNLGSRLEGANKSYGTHIIASEATYVAARHVVFGRWLDAVRVKGKVRPIHVYEILGRRAEAGSEPPLALKELIETFEEGMRLYRAQQWDAAEAAFRAADGLRPGGDPPSRVFLERIAHFRAHPPSATWDGVYEMVTK